MKLSEFDFNLPKNLIAQKPVSPRDACRLMVLDREKKSIKHDCFCNLGKYFQPGDLLVLNNSKVLPARLIGKKETGGRVEILLLKNLKATLWQCLVGFVPVTKQIGLKIKFSKKLFGEIIKRAGDTAVIKFNLGGAKLMEQILKIGQPPTPPYIKVKSEKSKVKSCYQTVYAEKMGSAAAPTAGMHFTKSLMNKLKKMGVEIQYVTLHVGLGTFQPVKEEDITKHKIHSEYFELDKKTAERLNNAKRAGRRIIACGTTTARVLESCSKLFPESFDAAQDKLRVAVESRGGLRQAQTIIKPQTGETNIFIYPGYKFKFVDALITNFHVPKSTLIMLVAAFAGKKFVDRAYKIAIKKKYRFYSFGDAMLIL
ncbi:MAG: tRNA preQ1(34) S-adenosylmethionine ribosyltransferase-isomerase QueA [Patescibacteria group bacterium]